MRSISSNGLAKLAQNLKTEPIVAIEIQWVDGGQRNLYNDKDKILQVGDMDDVVDVDGGGQSQQVTIQLDDIDGSIKAILDTNDIHKRPCWIYQWFEGLDYSDKFLIFVGQISSPIEWDEGDRTVSFTVISQIEDIEFGFSAEEGFFVDLPQDLIGAAWPVVFGTVANVPALELRPPIHGTLATGTGVADVYGHDLAIAGIVGGGITGSFVPNNASETDTTGVGSTNVRCPTKFQGWQASGQASAAAGGGISTLRLDAIYAPDPACVQGVNDQLAAEGFRWEQELAFQIADVIIFDGIKFPQGISVNVNIGGGHFTGVFTGDNFHITSRGLPTDQSAWRSNFAYSQGNIVNYQGNQFQALTGSTNSIPVIGIGGPWIWIATAPAQGFFWASPGADVYLEGNQQIVYEANILPSTVLRVAAFVSLDAGRQLVTIPDRYYTIRNTDFSTFTSTEIVLNQQLSTLNQGWEDQIYVSMTSPIGPNIVDILEWIIGRYTAFTFDADSFDAARTLLDNYPAHFAVLDRKNVLQVLQDIAYQSRCALYLKDGVFFIKYLSAEPDADDSIGASDILPNTLKITHTPTEDLITKYQATWNEDFSVENPLFMILRLNVSKYGTQPFDGFQYDYYIYTNQDLVRKTATFWLIRKANTWRLVQFSTPVSKLNLETFDCVALTIPALSSLTIKGIVNKATYNSETKNIDFEIWTPLKSGSTTPYDFAFPADSAETDVFPTLDERTLGLAGSGTSPNFLSFPPPNHVLATSAFANLYQNIGFDKCTNFDHLANEDFPVCRTDHGDRRPSDTGDTKPSPQVPSAGNSGQLPQLGGLSPIGKADCCAAAAKAQTSADAAAAVAAQAQKDANTAQQAADAAAAAGGTTNNQDKLDRLPKKPTQKTCTVDVTVGTITPTLVSLSPDDAAAQGHVLSSDAGQQGRPAISTTGQPITYSFNSLIAAQEFGGNKSKEISDKFDSYGFAVGENAEFSVNVGGSLGNDASGAACQEPTADKKAMVAYDNGK